MCTSTSLNTTPQCVTFATSLGGGYRGAVLRTLYKGRQEKGGRLSGPLASMAPQHHVTAQRSSTSALPPAGVRSDPNRTEVHHRHSVEHGRGARQAAAVLQPAVPAALGQQLVLPDQEGQPGGRLSHAEAQNAQVIHPGPTGHVMLEDNVLSKAGIPLPKINVKTVRDFIRCQERLLNLRATKQPASISTAALPQS